MEIFRESSLILMAAPLYTIVIVAEIVMSRWHDQPVYSRQGVVENLLLTSLNMVIDIVMRGVALVVLNFSYQHRLVEIENALFYWVVLLFAEDLVFYWLHWFDHR